MDDVVKEFLTESREGLDRLDAELVALEQNPADRDTLASVFRTIHTIKGTCSFLGFGQLEKVAHAGESLLALLRDGELALTTDIAGALLAMVDAIRTLLKHIEYTGLDGADYTDLVATLNRLQQGSDQSAVSAPASEPDETIEVVEAAPAESSPSDNDEAKADVVTEAAPAEPTAIANDELMEVIQEFLQESREGLDRLDNEFVALEQNPDDLTIVTSIFRTIHTIKGTCGFMGFSRLEKVTHAGESLLVRLRDGELRVNQDIANALLAMVDAVRTMVDEIANTGRDGDAAYTDLIALLTQLKEGGSATPAAAPPVKSEPERKPEAATPSQPPATAGDSTAAGGKPTPVATPAATPTPQPPQPAAVAETSIRVDVPLLDRLMNLVGELVLARNQIVEYSDRQDNKQFLTASQRLNLITGELQEAVMQTRMQPIHNIWAKLPRVVRDLAHSCGKQVRVEMEGKETELDKSLVEAMKDPLTHLVRNSVDHGIEPPATRRERGKPEEGRLLLRAYHEGGQVHIEINDDGAGINPAKIRVKALEKGLISAEQAARMSDQDACKLIFMPGLSTAEKVTNISGRGVGMDVVRTNIEKISGAIDLDSEIGRGTTVKIRVPLTLAIVPALIVTSAGERFAIPQASLLELIRLDEEQQTTAIEYIHGTPVYRLRGKLLPVVYLNQELGLRASTAGGFNIVVLQAEQRRFGLVVDKINDTQEIVIKPLAEVLKNIPVYAGATIMGDGRVALILDVVGLAQQSRILSEDQQRNLEAQQRIAQMGGAQRQTLLLVRSPGNGRLAIPLAKVARLEEIEPERVENAGGLDVIQYRGQILPLLHLRDVLEERRGPVRLENDTTAASSLLQVVVFGNDGCSVGLVVDEVLDIVEQGLEVKGRATRGGVSGTAVVQDLVTEMFDVDGFMEQAIPLLMDTAEA